MPCYDRAMASSLTSFLDSIRRALAVMLPEQGANTELLRAITSLLQIDPELRIKPGTLSMRFAKDLPVDTFGDNLVHRRTRESSTSGDNADEERRRLVWGSSSAAAEAESPVGVNQMTDSTGGDSEVGPFDFQGGGFAHVLRRSVRACAHTIVLALAPRVHAPSCHLVPVPRKHHLTAFLPWPTHHTTAWDLAAFSHLTKRSGTGAVDPRY
jgi:hypothetical protein|mmetsp:Transcript_17808/g.46637  ORF Transcript_17808/g.46637 Transcript_17808/m.46637 type:complete len:211 (+) Transcript_17808:463-1095(+)